MEFPLQPLFGTKDPDALLERFLEYVAEKGIELYAAQEEAILELFAGKNVILNTPTGSGKSLVAAAMHFYSASLGRQSCYTCPIKALVNEKFLALCRDFGPENVGMMTGDASVNRPAPILCCTAEILANIALRDGPQARVNDVIMDEFHYYSDPSRGVAWQAPLLTLPHGRFLLMSATLGDTRFFSEELERRTGAECVTVSSQERPVPLEFEYVENPLHETLDELAKRNRLPVYIVHFTQRSAAETAQGLVSLGLCSKEEKAALKEELQGEPFNSPFGRDMKRMLSSGVGLHHAGLLPRYRLLVEKLAQKGMLKFICGTDTLGVGVNVPIRTVLFTQLCKYSGDRTAILAARDFHQIAGRAGRKGFDDLGFVVAMAPEHVIENKRLEAKAGDDPKKKRRLAKRKPPPKGFVMWDEQTFERLKAAPPEPLVSQFEVSHGMLLNVLSRQGDGCRAMRTLIDECHSTEAAKAGFRKRAFQLFRALVERDIVEISPADEPGRKVRVNVELQDDFSLNQTLGLYCVDTLGLLDPQAEDYALKVISLAEAILEDPDVILRRQLDKLKEEKVAEMKAAGIEYEERMAKLDELEHPKPEREFIYSTFNAFADKHPWVGSENIKPKSIAREMYERYSSFSDYVKLYGLGRSEGVLLRHLTNVYRVLENTVPLACKTEAVNEVSVYLEHLLRRVDSSMLDEWELMRNPDYVAKGGGEEEPPPRAKPADITQPREDFLRLVRNEVFQLLRLLASKSYEEVAQRYDVSRLFAGADEETRWEDVALGELMEEFFATREWIRLDPEARAAHHTRIDDTEAGLWLVEQTIVDGTEANDWTLQLEVDLEASRREGRVAFVVSAIGKQG